MSDDENQLRACGFEEALDGPFAEQMADFDATAWRPFLRALDGLPPQLAEDDAIPDENDLGPQLNQAQIFTQCTGRTRPFTAPPRMAQACCGRRAGKTRIAALIVATAACFWRHDLYLSRGERARISLLAVSKDQSVVARNYVQALLEGNGF